MVLDEKLPKSIVNLAKKKENSQASPQENISKSYSLKQPLASPNGSRVAAVKVPPLRREACMNQSECWEPVRRHTEVQEKIMTNFITNYFKSK